MQKTSLQRFETRVTVQPCRLCNFAPMHHIEPFYNWRDLYTAETDDQSPFYGREYSEFYFSDAIYDHYIHPQWDNIESPTLFIKLLFTDYDDGYVIIELIGEWNDTLHNDIMLLKRNVVDVLVVEGINKFILIGENVLNFHASDDCYYEEWFEDVEDGWIALVNFRDQVIRELMDLGVDHYFVLGGMLDEVDWRTYRPLAFYQIIEKYVQRRIA